MVNYSLEAQPTTDSIVDFWSAVTPTKQYPADPRKTEQLIRWCQQDTPPTDLPCPPDPNWSGPNWLYAALQSQLTATITCNERRLRLFESRIGTAHDGRYLAELILRASYYAIRSEYTTARRYGQQAVRLADSLQTLQGWARVVQSRILFRQESNLPLAYSMLNQALELSRQQHDPYLEANALSVLGQINRRIYFGASLKALPYHQAALQIGIAQRDTMLIAQETLLLAFNYEDAGRFDLFIEHALQLIPLTEAKHLPRISAWLMVLASQRTPIGSVAIREALIQKSTQYSRLTGEIFQLEQAYYALYDIFMENSRTDEARQVALRIDSLNRLTASHRAYSPSTNLLWYQLAKRKGDKTSALAYLEKEYQTVSQRYQTQNAAALSQWEAIFHTEEQAILLKQRDQQYTYLIIVIGLVTLLLLTTAVALYFQNKSKRAVRRQMVLTAAQADQLRQVDALKGQFFANVSHELRTPLTLILGPLGSLLKKSGTGDQNGELLRTAHQSARRLLELVNEIMDLTKLEAGKLEVTNEPVNLHTLMSRIVANFTSLAHQSGVDLELRFDTDTTLTVELDLNKFQKILDNLLINAFKFTPSGGRICVNVTDSPGQIHIKVSDTGRGIYPNDLPHVFDRYFQTKQPGSPSEGGTGIGLALSAEFAKLLGGQLLVDSQWQQGTTFYLDIPKRIVPAEVTESVALGEPDELAIFPIQGMTVPVSSQPDNRRATLLLVEDDVSLRNYLTAILQPIYTVIAAQNGREALDQLSTLSTLPSLIISDLMMPVMDGFQLLETLKQSDTYRHIPVVMLTARADKTDKLQALRLGVDDYLLKPFDEDELTARVTNLLTHRQQRHALAPVGTNVTEEPGPVPIVSSVDVAWLERLEQHTQEQLVQFDLTADQLADAISVSRSTLFREIKRLTGLTPAQYITEARLQYARTLLENRRVSSVKEAAHQVGLRQTKHFSITFKSRFGKLPSDYL
ncbi:response regulator [Spirosoma validum]|uniref:histidine kinase n=1 Tax=Spirosoma validum TaxID=2771355 RepID=A0A927GEU4_9BACT|nr:response regulator [Spirosoma validum]MBD2754975.1 response regulator [Spirosoma validum]